MQTVDSFLSHCKLGDWRDQPWLIISLVYLLLPEFIGIGPYLWQISGWKFHELAITIQLWLCKVLLSVSHTKEACKSVLHIVKQGVSMRESIKTCVYGELLFSVFFHYIWHFWEDWIQRCLSAVEKDDARAMTTGQSNVSHPMMPLLRGWTTLRLTSGLWEDALVTTTGMNILFFSCLCTWHEFGL